MTAPGPSAGQWSALRVGAAYVGTVVGAGFASGQEVSRFFVHFGRAGLAGLGVATLCFVLFGVWILQLGHRERAHSHLPVVRAVAGPWLGRVIDGVVTFFLFAATGVMFAGSGAVFAEQFGLPHLLGTAVMAALTALTVLLGLRGVVRAIAAVAPVLLVSVLSLSLLTLWQLGLPPEHLAWYRPDQAAAGNWLVSAVLYASFNLVMAVAVLAPLGGSEATMRNLVAGGTVGGLALGAAAAAITLALLAGLPQTAAYEVPMLYLARLLPPGVQVFYSAILWAEVYTTAVGSLYGLTVRMVGTEPRRFRRFVIGSTVLALVASQAGFARLVVTLYPLVGYAGLAFLGALLWYQIQGGAARLRGAAARRAAAADQVPEPGLELGSEGWPPGTQAAVQERWADGGEAIGLGPDGDPEGRPLFPAEKEPPEGRG